MIGAGQLGMITSEKLANGLQLEFTNDRMNRIRTLKLPDQSGIEYVYNAVNLKEIHRITNNKRTYSYLEEKHNTACQIMEVSLPGNNGKVNFNYDLLGRCNQNLFTDL